MELRRLREAAAKSQEDAGRWLGIPGTAISKMETGKQRVTQAYLTLLLQLYNVGSPHAEALERLRRESSQRGWWAAYGDTVPSWFASYVGMEAAAAEVWTYEAEFIPGLLQIPQYTEAVTIATNPNSTAAQVQKFVEVRTARQQRLTSDEPLILRAVINEAAIRREVGGSDVMRAQIERIIEIAKLPNMTVQVLPFSAGAHPGMLGAFTALRFPEEPMNTVYVELDNGALYLEAPAEVERYAHTFERLTGLALDPESTVEWLTQFEERP
jgi:transcriptional regulator with XRE-family HTH domain